MKHLLLILAVALLASCQQVQKPTVVLNEICGKDADDVEFIEIANASDSAINLKGYKLRKMDEEGLEKTLYTFSDTIINAGGIITISDSQLEARISHKKAISIELLDPQGNTIDYFDSTDNLNSDGHKKGESYSRIPNITGNWEVSPHATWNKPNDDKVAPTDNTSGDLEDEFADEDSEDED